LAEQTERQGKTATKGDKLASGSAFSFVSTVTTRLATVVNSIIIIRVLTQNDYGVLSIVILTINLAAVFTTFQTPSALVKFLAAVPHDKPEEASRLLGAGFVLTLISTALTVSALAIIGPLLAVNLHDSRFVWLLLVASISMAMSAISSPFFATFQGFEKIKELGLRNSVSALLSIPSTVVFVVFLSLQGAILAMIVSTVISIFVNIALLRRIWITRRLKLTIPRERSIYGRIAEYALPAVVSSVVVTLVLWFCNSLLASIDRGNFTHVGLYSAGSGLAGYLLIISGAVGVPLVPIVSKFHQEKPDGLSTFMVRTLRVGAFLTLPPALILMALPEPFLRTLYGAAYTTAAPVLRLAAPAIYIASVGSYVGYGIAGTGQMRMGLLLNVIWGVPMVVISIVLAPTMREIGLAIAILVAYIIQFAATLAFAKYSWSVDIRQLTVTLLIAAISLPAAGFISLYSGVPRFLLALALVATVIFAGLYTMSPRELDVLAQPIRRMFARIRRMA
jgi:O-antigen/teichoic acid export membrane protein